MMFGVKRRVIKMDIEDFSCEKLTDELLKVCDELFSRGYTLKEIVYHIP